MEAGLLTRASLHSRALRALRVLTVAPPWLWHRPDCGTALSPQVLSAGLKCILCVGELKEQREDGTTDKVWAAGAQRDGRGGLSRRP